ncbi:unnamed protein product [Caenorhabditis brenneri]
MEDEVRYRDMGIRERLLQHYPGFQAMVKRVVRHENEMKYWKHVFISIALFLPLFFFEQFNFYPVIRDLSRRGYIPEISMELYENVENVVFGAPMAVMFVYSLVRRCRHNPIREQIAYVRDRYAGDDLVYDDILAAKRNTELWNTRTHLAAWTLLGMVFSVVSNFFFPGPLYMLQENFTFDQAMNGTGFSMNP